MSPGCGHQLCQERRHSNPPRYWAVLLNPDRRDAHERWAIFISLWFFIKCQCICWLTNNVPCFSGGSHLVETWRGQKQLARRSIFVLYCTNYIARNSSAWVAPARPLKSLAYQAVDTDLWGLALEALCVEEWQSTRIGVCSPGYRRTLQGDIAWALLATQVTLHNNLRDAPDIRLAG